MLIHFQEGNKIFSGGADNAGRMFDVTTGQATQVAQHDAPIKSVRWVDAQSGILATGSWDKTVKVCRVVTFFVVAGCLYVSPSVLGPENSEPCGICPNSRTLL
jgi:WD40 repeat protein